MQLLKQYLFFLACVTGFIPAFSQSPVPISENYFRNPLNIPISLAANFGEVRKDHYHMGLDIRTQQKENLPVYAAAEGYVSHVFVNHGGFGKAIYITHPGGYTTVYVHLNKFFDALDSYVKEKQYRDQSWEQDCDIPAGLFPVSKGQFIAWSGNTGASQGPHLHFEIRDTKTGNNLNPLLFNLGVSDRTAPVIYGLYWYDRRYSTYQATPKRILLKKENGEYVAAQKIVKVGSPRISLGVRAEDKTSASSFMFGIYSATLLLDDSLQCRFALNNFSYNDTRYLNACVDYTTWMSKGMAIQHLSRLPGNELPVFTTNDADGVMELKDTLPHQVSIDIKDATGNTSTVHFTLQYDPSLQENLFFTMNGITLPPGKENDVNTENVKLHFSAFSFYDNVNFVLGETAKNAWPYASVMAQLHNYLVPVHDAYKVSLKLANPAWAVYSDKMVMVQQNPRSRSVQKPAMQGQWYTASFKNLGTVQLEIDTTAPVIRPVGWGNGSHVGLNSTLRLRFSDNLGELKQVSATVDGNWLLLTHSFGDYVYEMDDHFPLGEHRLQVTATDVAGNTAVKEYVLVKDNTTINHQLTRKPLKRSGKKKTHGSKGRK